MPRPPARDPYDLSEDRDLVAELDLRDRRLGGAVDVTTRVVLQEVDDVLDAELLQPALEPLADSPQLPDRDRLELPKGERRVGA